MNIEEITAIRKKIAGEMALTDEVAQLLVKFVQNSELHIEIGCFWGGSAILAALAGANRVITIDSMEQFTDSVTPGAILDNFARSGAAHRISFVRMKSNPWPLPPEVIPDTAFIDGDHTYEGCLADWINLKDITRRMILFHDYIERKPGVVRVIDETVRKDPRWYEADRAGTLIAFSRKDL